MDAIRKAAQAVIDRWDSPLWKSTDVPTAVLMRSLRAALAAPQVPAGEPVACPYCAAYSTLGAVYYDQNCAGCVKRRGSGAHSPDQVAPEGWREALNAEAAPAAQEALDALIAKVPLPPKAITYEHGWELLDALQAIAVQRAGERAVRESLGAKT